jgi:hypothetical protein
MVTKLKTATALGITFPLPLLGRAQRGDRIIAAAQNIRRPLVRVNRRPI